MAGAAARVPWKGIRVLLPEWRVILMRPEPSVKWGATNPREVRFRVQPNMNKFEIKAYLTDVYKINVRAVSTQVVLGTRKVSRPVLAGGRRGGSSNGYKLPDYKIAFVTLSDKEAPFEYPELFPPDKKDDEAGATKDDASTE
eukprot:m.350049 g.350049  ORF g.350049 m.350049 type:complete len:142 (+) comp27961_c1_seq3:47-472(+)